MSLLGRAETPCEIDFSLLRGKRILVTGAGGSIGRAVVDLLSSHCKLTCLDISEEKIFWMKRELSTNAEFILGNVEDLTLREIKSQDIVIHTAAYKHVGLCEEFPEQAVKNNCGIVTNLAGLCWLAGVHFCFISTDKTVDAISIMGKTKWVAERIVDSWRHLGLKTTMLRFANVLGSSGSVLQIWDSEDEQIEVREHMERWFITFREAASGIVRALIESNEENYLFAIKPDLETRIIDLAEKYVKMRNRQNPKAEGKKIKVTEANAAEKTAEKFCYENQYLEKIEGFLYAIRLCRLSGEIRLPGELLPERNSERGLIERA